MQTKGEAPDVSLTSVSVGKAPAQVYPEEFRVIVVWNTVAIIPPLGGTGKWSSGESGCDHQESQRG